MKRCAVFVLALSMLSPALTGPGASARPARHPAPGWTGEQLIPGHHDDWEPAIATDPRAPYVYRLVTRYGDPACPRNCPDGAIVLQSSADDGVRWGPSRYLCRCAGSPWQADPQIEVASRSGIVDAAFLNRFNVWFTTSSDHGKTWSKAKSVIGNVARADKPILVTSASGKNIYVAYNGPTAGDAYVAVSHDFGATWRQRTVINSPRYVYAFGGHVLHGGAVAFSETVLQYAGGRRLRGVDQIVVIRSDDGGATWTKKVVDVLQLGGTVCSSAGCPPDFYDGHSSLGVDGSNRVLLVADGALRPDGVRRVYSWLSPDGGVSWGARVRLSPNSTDAGFPAAVGTKAGQFRVWFMDRRTGRWNVMYRTTTDGRHWTGAVRLSNATSGAPYVSRAGFREVYGDYGEIDVTDTGKTVAVWGEGPSYTGPGGCWFARQR